MKLKKLNKVILIFVLCFIGFVPYKSIDASSGVLTSSDSTNFTANQYNNYSNFSDTNSLPAKENGVRYKSIPKYYPYGSGYPIVIYYSEYDSNINKYIGGNLSISDIYKADNEQIVVWYSGELY